MKSTTGLKKEMAAAIATLLGPSIVVPILFLMIEKDEFVRFWAMQSVVTSVGFLIVLWGIGIFAFTIILAPEKSNWLSMKTPATKAFAKMNTNLESSTQTTLHLHT